MPALRVSIDVSAVPVQPAGAGRYTIELLKALREYDGLSLALVARRGDATRWASLDPGAKVVDIVPSSRPLRLVYEQVFLGRELGRLNVEVHHGPHYTMPRNAPVPSVVTIHDVTFFDRPEVHERSKVMFFRRAIADAAKRASVLVCVSERTALRLAEVVDVEVPVIVAPHGIDHGRFSAVEPSEGSDTRILSGLGLDLQRRHIVALGTLEPRKGLGGLLGAFELVAREDPAVELVLVGQRGWGMEAFEASLAASPVRSRVKTLGYVPDEAVPALLRKAAVVAYPSIDEGFGLPALEGLACGAPVVTTEGSVMADLCGEAPWLVAPGDPDALAHGIGAALSSTESERDRRRALGQATAATYTWSQTAARHVEAYEMARARGRRASRK